MPRRQKTSPIEDVVSLLALLPWWISLILGAVSYFVLHAMATSKAPAVTLASQAGTAMAHSAYVVFAIFGQYLLPALFLAAAVVSFVKRKSRTELVQNVAASKAADALEQMSWQDFERLVGRAFEMDGYSVTETGGGRADGGVDLVLRRGGEKFLVQCKQWKAYKVGVDVVRELYGAMAAKGATGGFVVTSGSFTDAAKDFAHGRNVKLLDGSKLRLMMGRAQKEEPVTPRAAPVSSPACPICGAPMVLRTAKQGARAGSKFWGCSNYPKCKGIVNT